VGPGFGRVGMYIKKALLPQIYIIFSERTIERWQSRK